MRISTGSLALFNCMCFLTIVGTGCFDKSPRPIEAGEPVFRIQCRSGNVISHGTAFAIQHDGKTYLVTAYHLMNEGGILSYYTRDWEKVSFTYHTAKVLKDYDLHIARVSDIQPPVIPYTLSDTWKAGDACMALGYVKSETFTSMQGRIRDAKLYSTAPIDHGMSGGPLLRNGKVIGMTTSIDATRHGGVHLPLKQIMENLE